MFRYGLGLPLEIVGLAGILWAVMRRRPADVRMMFFSENSFSMDEFIRRKIGPVIRKDELEYFKEIRLTRGARHRPRQIRDPALGIVDADDQHVLR